MPEQQRRRLWLRDPFLFGMALAMLALTTVLLAVTGRLFSDPALMGLAVISVIPAFWLFYQRGREMSTPAPSERSRRR